MLSPTQRCPHRLLSFAASSPVNDAARPRACHGSTHRIARDPERLRGCTGEIAVGQHADPVHDVRGVQAHPVNVEGGADQSCRTANPPTRGRRMCCLPHADIKPVIGCSNFGCRKRWWLCCSSSAAPARLLLDRDKCGDAEFSFANRLIVTYVTYAIGGLRL